MKVPMLDARSHQDILREIRQKSLSYTPEWRFDEENPDVGTALALIFSEMFEGVVKRFNRVPEKNKVSFFDTLNASLLPAVPAVGYVQFGLAGKPAEGISVAKNTPLLAEVVRGEQATTTFETQNDVYVSPAELQEIFFTCGARDNISRIYQRKAFLESPEPFALFAPFGDNLQAHQLYLCCDDSLAICKKANFSLHLRPYRRNSIPEQVLSALEKATWEYMSEGEEEEEFVPFEACRLQGQQLLLDKTGEQRPFFQAEKFGQKGFWLRCSIQDAKPFQQFAMEGVSLVIESSELPADTVNGAGNEHPLAGGFAFGEKPMAFTNLTFCCEEALSKRGAEILLQFDLDFMSVPIDVDVEDSPIQWKLIMKKSDIQPDPEYDITVEDVIWEYYNGKGWGRLFAQNQHAALFNARHRTGEQIALRFRCPEDMTPFLVGATEGCCIRARILKINNAFKVRGQYISPYVSSARFSYHYKENPITPRLVLAENNRSRFDLLPDGEKGGFLEPFSLLPMQAPCNYFAFDLPPVDGPINILFAARQMIEEAMPSVSWEYLSHGGWRALNAVDQTQNFRKTGLLTFIGNRDFQKKALWGEDRYWIRAVDYKGSYLNPKATLQYVNGVYSNASSIKNIETQPEESFFIPTLQENFVCKLIHAPVHQLTVWVDEGKSLSDELLHTMLKEEQAVAERSNSGELLHAWVRWQEVEHFFGLSPNDRCFIADRNEGIIRFSDGKNGRIPPSGDTDSIRVRYSTGGGEVGNLPVGHVNRPYRSLSFVNLVSNPILTSGGCPQETTEEAINRSAAALRHRGRAVTALDYEALAKEASRNILKAHCFANCNPKGQSQPGSVTLVILQKDYAQGGEFFGGMKRLVTDYISSRISSNVVDLERFSVIEPWILHLSVTVEAEVKDFDRVFSVCDEINQRLTRFLHPITGNFDGKGWNIGTLPNRTQIVNCLKDVLGIVYIKNILITAYEQSPAGLAEVDFDFACEARFALAVSGKHQVLMSISERG